MVAIPAAAGDCTEVSVLIADPGIDVASEVVKSLVSRNFRVYLAVTAQEAHAIISSASLNFALLELQFADGDCFPLIEEIRRANPCSRILIHSAYCNLAVAVSAAKLGANDVLPKPVETAFALALLLEEGVSFSTGLGNPPNPNTIVREHVTAIYSACGRNMTQTAKELGMHRRTLQRMLARNLSNETAPPCHSR